MANRTNSTAIILGKYKIFYGASSEFDICYDDYIVETSNYWQSTSPWVKTFPVFTMQLGVLILVSRVLALIFKPLRQPYFLPDLLAGVVLGPTVIQKIPYMSVILTPFEGNLFLETMAELGLTFYMFLVGLEMDITPIRKVGRAALSVAMAGLILPMCAGAALHYLVLTYEMHPKSPWEGFWSWAIALSVTSFPDLARILADLKLMYTDLGKTALSAAVISNLISWLLIVITVCVTNGHVALNLAIPLMVCMTAFWFLIRPLISWLVNKSAEKIDHQSFLTNGHYNDKHVYFILIVVICSGYLTELCGAHAMFGGFMFGLMIPSGELGSLVMEKIEEFVVGIMLPPIFLITGMRTHLRLLFSSLSPGVVALVVILACSAKILSTLLVCLLLKCPKRDSLALGFLMNTKGVLVLIILNQARAVKVLDQQTFSCMVLIILVMTMLITPVVSYTHKSVRHLKQFYRRNLEKSKPDLPLRVLACIHSTKNLSALINLLRISNPTRKSPLTIFAVHLVELVGRATALLIFHDKKKDNIGNNATREKAEAEQIVCAFESFEKEAQAAHVRQLTAVSPYDSMHEDVGNFALDKLTNIILIPFHKQPDFYGGWRDENLQHRQVNENLLATAPCSVGLLVDRGLTSPFSQESYSLSSRWVFRVAMLFVEGADDREALAYAWRMAGTPRLTLTVVRFVPGKDVCELDKSEDKDEDEDDVHVYESMLERENERQRDADYINEFRFRTMNDQSVAYIEKQVSSEAEIVSMISSVDNCFDLYVVGRGHGRKSPLLSGLSWCDYPELGSLGETLASIEAESPASVLVVQQSAPKQSGSKKSRDSSKRYNVFVNHRKLDHD